MNNYPEGMPCWAPGAAEHLASILKGTEVGFEWGGGASSIWLAPRIAELKVMETDGRWAEKILNEHIDALLGVWVRDFNDPNYLDTARTCEPRPNLWLIDGFRRIDCLALVNEIARPGDIVVCDDALDYASRMNGAGRDIHSFDMPHPHAGLPCVSAKNTRHRNTNRTHAPATKETWIWQV